MSRFSILLILLLLPLWAAEKFPDSVVKLDVTTAIPDYKRPWESSRVGRYIGSGVLIGGGYILTAAHVVTNARMIELQKENDPRNYPATVRFISHQADLALLKARDPKFYEGLEPLAVTTDVALRDAVTVLGYPKGGKHLSITTGVVSRIGYGYNIQSFEYLPQIQIDAAVNAGNSGGPVLDSRNRIVGIVSSSLKNSSNISYIVPGVLIEQLLRDIRDGKVDGLHRDDFQVVKIDNDALRSYYGLNGRTGLMVQRVGPDETLLQAEDILLEIDGKPIADDGSIVGPYGRIDHNFAFHRRQIGEKVPMKILRHGKEIRLKYPVKKVHPLLYREFEKQPRFFIYGGFVFVPLTYNTIFATGEKCNISRMLRAHQKKTPGFTEGVAVLPDSFPTAANHGYQPRLLILDTLDGRPVKSFDDLVERLEHNVSRFVRFRFMDDYRMIFDDTQVRTGEAKMKRMYHLHTLEETR